MIKRTRIITGFHHKYQECQDTFVVNWMVGNTCNYKCSYCPTDLHDGSSPWYDLDTVKRFCDQILEQKKSKKIFFEFTGGEVSMWSRFPELCRYLNVRSVDIGMISNGSRTLRWWEEIKPFIKDINLSFHSEFSDVAHFKQVIDLLKDSVGIHVNVMMLPQNFEYCLKVSEEILQAGVNLTLQPLTVGLGTQLYHYSEVQKDIIYRGIDPARLKNLTTISRARGTMIKTGEGNWQQSCDPQQLISRGENSWKGWDCFAGVEQIVVDRDGLVYRGWCKEGGKIGHIADEFIMLPDKPVRCTKSRCHCGLDIMCTKIRDQKSEGRN